MTPAVRPFKNQDFLELKKECVKGGRLFEDPEFPAADESLFYSKAPPHSIEWKRPGELCNDPYLFVDGISHHDLHQGQLGNCWFVAACSGLALHQALWTKVIPNWKKQEWDPKRPHKYAGIFHFHFWCLGNWVDVIIDDRLPTIDGNLIYCHSNVKNEFWCALLEKAYAKLSGSYESLDGGSTADAIVDFTGAVVESINLTDEKYIVNVAVQTKLFEELLKVHRQGGLTCCHLKAPSYSDGEKVTPLGLVKGHAYSLTAIKKVTLGEKTLCFGKTTKLFMVRMRNPWGKKEWKGAWNDESEEWNKVSRSEKGKLGLTVRNDGEFWMTFEDWCKNFSHADVCHVINTSLFSQHKTWEKGEAHGKWTDNTNALLNRSGGCFNNKTTFFQNPQYIFEVEKEEDEVLVSLQQEDQRIHKKSGKGDRFIIGCEILKVEQNRECRIHKLQGHERVASLPYMNLRSVFLRKVLKKGKYVIIPTTFYPGISCNFILRLFTDVPTNFRELLLDKPSMRCWNLLWGYPKRVTQVSVRSVEGVQPQGETEGAELYVIIKCEHNRATSEVHRNATSAVFDVKAIFYRRNINKPITVQVWGSKLMCDQFLGQVLLAASPNDPQEEQALQLHNKDGREAEEMPGRVNVKVVSSDDLLEL
ncbi:PREDICTED: calpain-5-like [Nanorana parkeri]|uniref:calpain-5-like n=1 Tax=Nanorana parkeri TaxID=125878 RepID=UPI000854E391|nr:PREDICTED: calpain-5-like [Nanorana parkeri]